MSQGDRELMKTPVKARLGEEVEEGELDDSDNDTTLKRFDRNKSASLNPANIKDSLKRSKKTSKRPRRTVSSDEDSSESSEYESKAEGSFLTPRASSSKAQSISILSNGILDDLKFMRDFAASDRRELKDLKSWAAEIKTLISDVTFKGGKVYKDFVEKMRSASEILEMLMDEAEEKSTRKYLKMMKQFFDTCHKLLNIHETTAGSGNIILSLVQSLEFQRIFGSFESELIGQSHRMGG